ncbi:MAG: winged helix DNA-binding domain-containing protein [Coriobacteriales bacterium]|jgi:hypothetical protein|nr:winged helix DNA-binding domain-containing protein [Coriobacteriales bacterium]
MLTTATGEPTRTHSDIRSQRLVSHGLTGACPATPAEVVARLGAVQAQDAGMARWAVGIRLPGSTERQVAEALAKGEILRTHVLRPTWHLVAREDIRRMLAVSAGRIRSALRASDKRRGIDEADHVRVQGLVAEALGGGNHLTGRQIAGLLEAEGIGTGDYRLYLFLMRAETDALIASGVPLGSTHTYALLDERAPRTDDLPFGESVCRLARVYLRGHGPATVQDFSWWSGLSAGEAAKGFSALGDEFEGFGAGGRTSYKAAGGQGAGGRAGTRQAHLLPAFDEYIIAYRDRSAAVPAAHAGKVFTKNGIFRPTILVNGRVVGTWRSPLGPGRKAELDFFEPPSKGVAAQVAKAAARRDAYYGKE